MILIVSCGNSNQGIYVSKEEFGDKWPFTVQDGYVYSVKRMVAVFKHNGIEYALNGFAKMYSKKHKKGYKDIVGIWKDDSKFPGTKIINQTMFLTVWESCRPSARKFLGFSRKQSSLYCIFVRNFEKILTLTQKSGVKCYPRQTPGVRKLTPRG